MSRDIKQDRGAVDRAVAGLLDRAPAARKLDPDGLAKLRAAMVEIGMALAPLDAVDFPTFVSDLIEGTFDAIVDASIRQMEAYADLLADVAKSVDGFMADNVTDAQARDYLAIQGLAQPGRVDPMLWKTLVVPAACRELAERRQKLLATMVLMGITRIQESDDDD